ncbi:family 10 glycosylhydrolase [Spirulina subsalsa FACHB-351]|uniref:Family 10 glycosylhydrolase n=1 Tax=Spirulina subsalsa FACHB-351 TaxID=234711 RepID=A0ABT3LB22_9CYAN|nr:family 10 glycosylhydrolase [Spirulina subsalsa]MCW6038685.1 family 10 glycosylhydrolase [Spirulina subsalsa FACHB-351]
MNSSFSLSLRPQFWRKLVSSLLIGTTLSSLLPWSNPALAQTNLYCQFSPQAIAEKDTLRERMVQGDQQATRQYQDLIKTHGDLLRQCRSRNWPQTQAIWLRLYPCDASPGALDRVLDHIVEKGYNEVYIEVFYNSQVLLPANDNPTPWLPVLRSPGQENIDLLATAIQKGRDRGLKVYAWLFTMNFGYGYGVRSDRQGAIARNGRGQNSLAVVHDGSQLFIDPYSRQAQTDYYQLVQAVLKRRPDGVLFDYIRYPRGSGQDSVAGQVQDLWIYGPASRQALLQRAGNNQGRELIERFLNRGSINGSDLQAVRSLYPNESGPQWQGLSQSNLQTALWDLAVAHAAQGVIDFLNFAATPVMRQGLPAGAVFFPLANQPVGQQGYDSRLQPWDRFSTQMEWHPMVYSVCGHTRCILEEVQRVVNRAPSQTRVVPALAGFWGRPDGNRPSLDAQMQDIRRYFPQINAVSHFAYSWQEPQRDRERQACRP